MTGGVQLPRQRLRLRQRGLKFRRVLQPLRQRLELRAAKAGKKPRSLGTAEQPEYRDRDIGLRHRGSREPRPGKLRIEPLKSVAYLLVTGIQPRFVPGIA